MRWFILIAAVAVILLVFGIVYAVSGALNKRKQPRYKTTAPDDDPKFLRDLAEKLKAQENKNPDTDAGSTGEEDPAGDK